MDLGKILESSLKARKMVRRLDFYDLHLSGGAYFKEMHQLGTSPRPMK